jgi:starch synthase
VGSCFVFNWTETDALYNTLIWATRTYRSKPEVWQRMQRRAMEADFSWDKSAHEYIDLYQQLLDKGET